MATQTEKRKKIGLALSGGAARGLAHIGVLQVLDEAKIPIDMVAGTSIGSVVGASYAWDQDVARLSREALDATWKKLAPFIDPAFPRTGLIKGNKLKELFATYVGGDVDFKDLKLPFACVATDIETGEEVIYDSGPVVDALRASTSIPGIFKVVQYRGRYVVDGGLTTPVPVNVVRDMGADFIIGVNVNPDVSAHAHRNRPSHLSKDWEPNILHVIVQSIYITTHTLAENALTSADIAIEPPVGHINLGDFNSAHEIVAAGRAAAEAKLPEIREKLADVLPTHGPSRL